MSSLFANRRQVLSGLMKLLVFIGLIFISIPFISSFSTSSSEDKLSADRNWVISLPVSELSRGKVKQIPWAGGVFWVYARTKSDIASLEKFESRLRDKDSMLSDQPVAMKSRFRSAHPDYFVFIPRENKRSCQVRFNSGDEPGMWIEPCYSSRYDVAGRVFRDSGNKGQLNLAVPDHRIEDGILKIAAWSPKL